MKKRYKIADVRDAMKIIRRERIKLNQLGLVVIMDTATTRVLDTNKRIPKNEDGDIWKEVKL